MILQKITWPKVGLCTDIDMYIHADALNTTSSSRSKELILESVIDQEELILNYGNGISFDTYFNSFSYLKWKKYTELNKLSLVLKLSGKFIVLVEEKTLYNDEVLSRILLKREVSSTNGDIISFDIDRPQWGMVYFKLYSLEDGSKFMGGYYCDNSIDRPINDIKIGLNICTYKREEYIKNNINLLKNNILENTDSNVFGKMEVLISDNGNSLNIDTLASEHVHIFSNKNVGGAGGFTRGLIEILKDKNKFGITHVLMMDDDVIVSIDSFERTYALLSILKKEYEEAFVGGAMLRTDKQYIQVESGASWNAGRLMSNKQNMDMRNVWDCLFNEVEEYVEYNAWWYCCIPMKIINDENLPLPLFVRGDDVEYGLRNMKNLILLNGVCVWHEPFENKYSSALNYYIVRNLLIDNAIHWLDFDKKEAKKYVQKLVDYELKLYRYKNVELICKGVEDFLRGPEFLLNIDAEKNHKVIITDAYQFVDIGKLSLPLRISDYSNYAKTGPSGFKNFIRKITYNGIFLPASRVRVLSAISARPENTCRAKKVLFVDSTLSKGFECKKDLWVVIKELIHTVRIMILIDKKFNYIVKEYKSNKEIMSIGYWERMLSK